MFVKLVTPALIVAETIETKAFLSNLIKFKYMAGYGSVSIGSVMPACNQS